MQTPNPADACCDCWTALNPATAQPTEVVPLSFYHSLEDQFNEQLEQLQDYREAHELSKELLANYGLRIAELRVENHELRAQLAALGAA